MGEAFFALQKFEEARNELEIFIASASDKSDLLHSALITLINAATQMKDLAAIDLSIEGMQSFYPGDIAIENGKFSKALLLREQNHLKEAKDILTSLPQKAEVLLELIHICNQLHLFEEAREKALFFLSEYGENANCSFVKKYLIFASTELATTIDGKKQLLDDLKNFGDDSSKLLLAKTYFSLQQYGDALLLLLNLDGDADTYLLTALCYRDGFQDNEQFCEFGEKVFTVPHSSIEEGPLHSALFNAYLELSKADAQIASKAKEHLFAAFIAKMPLASENLIWLSERFIEEGNSEIAISLLESVKEEKGRFLLSKLYTENKRYEEAAALLEDIDNPEARLLLGEIYVSLGKKEVAKELFSLLCQDSASLKTILGASACYKRAKLEVDQEQTLMLLKNLVLQKNITAEPLYLEASLDYIDVQEERHKEDPEKKLQLLEKTKRDFENTEDLLSKDYHAMRVSLEKQNHIYLSYMDLFDAEIIDAKSKLESDPAEQKILQAKAKDLLLKIIEDNAHTALVARANKCLKP